MANKQASRRSKRPPGPPSGTNPTHQFIVVSYDIPDDRRRNRIHKLLQDYGQRVQYSVFECQLTPGDYRRLRGRLRPLLEREEDDVRFYLLCGNCVPKALVWSKRKRKPLSEAIVV